MNHRFNPTSLREYDIRGIVGETLGEADAYAVGRTFGTLLRRGGGSRVVVGRDGRVSSPALEASLVQGLTESGVDVVRIGLGPTPMCYYSEAELDVDGGIQITGSHNPGNYNGFKMVMFGIAFFGQDIQKLGRMAAEGDWESGGGSVRDEDVRDRYVDRLLQDFDGQPFRIGWDNGNGRCGEISSGGEAPARRSITPLPKSTANFPNHHPGPDRRAEPRGPEAHRSQSKAGSISESPVRRRCDRIGAVDGRGPLSIWGDQPTSILAEPVLRRHSGGTIIAT
jgi:phosphomannomutase